MKGILIGLRFTFAALWKFLVWTWPITRPVLLVLSWPFRFSFGTLFRLFPAIRFLSRLRRKWTGRENVRLADIEKQMFLEPEGYDRSKLEFFLADKKMFAHVVQNSHFADLKALAMTSRFNRRLLEGEGYGKHDPKLPAAVSLRERSCVLGSKYQCWACGAQICSGCKVTIQSKAPNISFHLQNCEPQCSSCYLKNNCVRGAARSTCTHERAMLNKIEQRQVCSNCYNNQLRSPRIVSVKVREARGVKELRHLESRGLKCGSCSGFLDGSGPRWWCRTCCPQSECLSKYHVSWGEKAAKE
jgi:hypothetical protein